MTGQSNERAWTIRRAAPGDYEAIRSIWLAAGLQARIRGRESREAFLHQLQQFSKLYLVAVDRAAVDVVPAVEVPGEQAVVNPAGVAEVPVDDVPVKQERIIGMVFGSHDHRKGWINRLAVLPEYRRRGVAAALVTTCDEAIRAQGIGIVAALVETHNTESAALFEKLGYVADVPVRYYRKLSHPDA